MKPHLRRANVLLSLCWLLLFASSAPAQLPANDSGFEPPARALVSNTKPDNTDPLAALRTGKLIYVRSSSLLVGVSVIEDKLQKRAEFSQMGLAITRDAESADLILELHHDVFTKYVYTAIDPRTKIVVASGKLSSLGGTVAGKVAKRFLKQVLQARTISPRS